MCPPVPPAAIKARIRSSVTGSRHCRHPLSDGALASPEKNPKPQNYDQSADQTKLLTDHGEDEIRVCERQKQHLLPALCEAESVRSARPDGNQRLHDLIARALLIGPRIDERGHASPAKRSEDHHLAHKYKRGH